jgi:RNase P subunit RPR2
MTPLQTLIRAAKIKGRICPQCQALMLLCDITPVGLVAEQHKFTCVDCNHIEVQMVEDRKIAALAA